MKKVALLNLTFLLIANCFAQSPLNGIYVGLEPDCWTYKNGKTECYSDPARPERKWYHLTYLKIWNDSVFVDQSPISIYKSDTLYSSSDGAFYYYNGHIQQDNAMVIIQLNLIFCDYCAIPADDNPNAYLFPKTKSYNCKIMSDGILINGYFFRRTSNKENIISEHPEPYLK